MLAGHDIVLLGERGQGKTRLIRTLVGLLDEWTPVVAGCEINDHPYAPVCARCRRLAAELGDELPVAWKHRGERYGEKLATPDTSRRRPDRRRRPDQGRRGSHARRSRDGPLRPGAAHQPRHLRDQRAARPGRAHPGRAAQRARGARHPGPRLHRCGCPLDLLLRGQRQPRGLHQPRPDHHPAEGPLRRRGPHALPARARRRAGVDAPGGAVDWGDDAVAARCPTTCSRWSPASPAHVRESPAGRPALRRLGPVRDRRGRDRRGLGRPAGRAHRRAVAVARVADLPSVVPAVARQGRVRDAEEGREFEVLEHLLRRAIAETFRARLAGLDLRAAAGDSSTEGATVETGELVPATDCCPALGTVPGPRLRRLEPRRHRRGRRRRPGSPPPALEFALEGLHLNERLAKEDGPTGPCTVYGSSSAIRDP